MRIRDPIQEINRERWRLLRQVDQLLELPMVVLGFAWLALLVWELTAGLTPFWGVINTAIWATFVVDFLIKLLLAPAKTEYLKRNWLVAISLAVPALRVYRVDEDVHRAIAQIDRMFRPDPVRLAALPGEETVSAWLLPAPW